MPAAGLIHTAMPGRTFGEGWNPAHHRSLPFRMAKRKDDEGAQFVRYFGPVLDALRKLGGSGKPDEVMEQIATDLALSDDIQNDLLASGESRFRNQVSWARFYLVREGLVDSSKRGVWSLTERGRTTSLTNAQGREIFLRWVRIFQAQRKAKAPVAEPIAEQVAEATGAPPKDYRTETIEILLGLSPNGFERLSQRLLREAGFTQVVVTGQSGDGGIDGHGTLQINPLVSFKVLFQCKRYTKSVSPSHVRDFRGAMAGRADKGIIITTGSFTAEARREASRDGERFAGRDVRRNLLVADVGEVDGRRRDGAHGRAGAPVAVVPVVDQPVTGVQHTGAATHLAPPSGRLCFVGWFAVQLAVELEHRVAAEDQRADGGVLGAGVVGETIGDCLALGPREHQRDVLGCQLAKV